MADEVLHPTNNLVTPLLTDLYQITMAYAYWKCNRHEDEAVFDLYFRKCPFKGEFCIFAGLEEALRFLSSFKFRENDIEAIRKITGIEDEKFFDWLRSINCDKLIVHAIPEGSIVFPMLPLISVRGPLAVCQLLETTFLTLVNFPSLIATNAVRHRLIAGKDKTLVEFGLRRAQGPDGGISASRYSYIGGFDATSNTLAGSLFSIPVKGTHAHAFVCSFREFTDLKNPFLMPAKSGAENDSGDKGVNLLELAIEFRKKLGYCTNDGELAAFVGYAIAFPSAFTALVDTYDTLKSGIPNFLSVAAGLHKLGYKALGIRLDSGDLAYLSTHARKEFQSAATKLEIDYFTQFKITASNEINEETINSLNQQGHEIDIFGVGTNLVTCQSQPALGCVYKLVQINGTPRIKLSQSVSKVTLPGEKAVYRLHGKSGYPIFDLIVPVQNTVPTFSPNASNKSPEAGQRVLCVHPFEMQKRAFAIPTKVERLDIVVFEKGKIVIDLPTINQIRERVIEQLKIMRPDHLRFLNPTPYKVSVTQPLYDLVHALWGAELPTSEYEG